MKSHVNNIRRHKLKLFLGGLLFLIITLAVFSRLPPSPAGKPGSLLFDEITIVYSPGYRVSFFGIEIFHSFDIGKYDRIANHLVEKKLIQKDGFFVPEPVDMETLSKIHDENYLDSLYDNDVLSEALEVPIPSFFSHEILDSRILAPFRLAVGGTVEATENAIEHGMSINLGGGFHHAHPDKGHGFCVYNDIAVAIWTIRKNGFKGKVLIVDTDAHQGDGNHAFFTDDPLVFSFSMHEGDIFPEPKLTGNRDVILEPGTDDEDFIELLKSNLGEILDSFEPELVFHVAGADVLYDDPLTNLAVTIDGLIQRDLLVKNEIRSRNIPLVHLLAGGYGPSAAEAQARSVEAILQGD